MVFDDWETLVKTHHRHVYNICQNIVRNSADADDLTQETLIKAFRHIDNFRGESAFGSWLYRIAVNECLMWFKREKRVGTHNESDNLFLTVHGGVMARIAIREAMIDLPEGYKQAVILHDVWGYEHQEIAKILGTSKGTSQSQLHKARRKLRKRLNKKFLPRCVAHQSNEVFS